MKKCFVSFIFLICGTSFAQEGWLHLGRTEEMDAYYKFGYGSRIILLENQNDGTSTTRVIGSNCKDGVLQVFSSEKSNEWFGRGKIVGHLNSYTMDAVPNSPSGSIYELLCKIK